MEPELTKEIIEDEEWINTTNSATYSMKIYTFDKNNWMLGFDYIHHRISIQIRDFGKHEELPLGFPIYVGYCKDISEFRKIFNLLNYDQK